MSKRQLFATLALVLLLSAVLRQQAKADAGPAPPSMTFYFQTDGDALNITDIVLRVCETPACDQFTLFPPPDEQHEPWEKIWLRCQDARCVAVGVPSRKYYQLVVRIDGKPLISNVFTKKAYGAKYQVTIEGATLRVQETLLSNYTFLDLINPWHFLLLHLFDLIDPWHFLLFWPALVWTLSTETVVWGVAYVKGWRKVKVYHLLIANLISLPVVWFTVPFLIYDGHLAFATGEAFAFLFEGGVYFIFNRAARISAKEAFAFSAIANLTSLLTSLGAWATLGLLFALPFVFSALLFWLIVLVIMWFFAFMRSRGGERTHDHLRE